MVNLIKSVSTDAVYFVSKLFGIIRFVMQVVQYLISPMIDYMAFMI